MLDSRLRLNLQLREIPLEVDGSLDSEDSIRDSPNG